MEKSKQSWRSTWEIVDDSRPFRDLGIGSQKYNEMSLSEEVKQSRTSLLRAQLDQMKDTVRAQYQVS